MMLGAPYPSTVSEYCNFYGLNLCVIVRSSLVERLPSGIMGELPTTWPIVGSICISNHQ